MTDELSRVLPATSTASNLPPASCGAAIGSPRRRAARSNCGAALDANTSTRYAPATAPTIRAQPADAHAAAARESITVTAANAAAKPRCTFAAPRMRESLGDEFNREEK
jgi:hypothetical protein